MRANKDFLKQLATQFASDIRTETQQTDPITFAQSLWGLNYNFLPAQKFIIKCLYRMPLDNQQKYIPIKDVFAQNLLDMYTELQFLQYLIKNKKTNIPSVQWYNQRIGKKRYTELLLNVGRRGSKSSIVSVIANVQLYRLMRKFDPQQYYGFPKGDQIFFTFASISDDAAQDLLNKVRTRLYNCQIFKDKVINDGAGYLTLQTDNDIAVNGKRQGVPSIKINTGACSSNGLRGKNNIMVVLDEIAFFSNTQNSKFSGTQIYNALTPSCASFKRFGSDNTQKGDGLIIQLSSPNKQQGIFFETYQDSFRMPQDILMFNLYTALMNHSIDSNFLKMQYKKNPQAFDVQYGANFSTKSAKFIGNKQELYQCVDKNKTQNQSSGILGIDYYMAIDLAYKNDATAIAIVHKQDDIYVVDYVNAYFPGSSDIWQFPNSIYKQYNELADYLTLPINVINDKIMQICKLFPIKRGTYDQWSGGFALEQLLYQQGLDQIQMNSYGPVVNSITFELFQTLLRDKKISFWNCEPLLQEILTLQCEQVRNNKKVQAPKQQGYHDDLFDAVSRAIHLCYNSTQRIFKKVTIGAGGIGESSNIKNAAAFHLTQIRKAKNHGFIQTRNTMNLKMNNYRFKI